jgi:hypothetical protein
MFLKLAGQIGLLVRRQLFRSQGREPPSLMTLVSTGIPTAKGTMKTKLVAILALTLLSTLNPQLSTCFAQGALTPPGPPAPTMLTLNQVEPRTPISSLPFTISSPGSYYLTGNMAVSSGDAIDITASGVTLDLNGFTLSSTEFTPTGTGILLASGITDITILNGHIMGGVFYSGGYYIGHGFANGIYYSVNYSVLPPNNVRVSGVSVSGCAQYGIYFTESSETMVESCTAFNIGSYGIYANSVVRSTAESCGGTAIYAILASDCFGGSTGSSAALSAVTANNCYGEIYGNGSSTGDGLDAQNANNCNGFSLYGIGLNVTTATGCYGSTVSGSAGLSASTANNCQGQNGSGNGLNANTANNCYGVSSGGGFGLNANQLVTSSSGTSDSGTGLYAAQAATGCYGYSGTGSGLNATTVNNCIGQSGDNGYGLYASQLATGSSGTSVSGTGLYAKYIAIGCAGFSTSGTGLQTTAATSSGGLPNVIAPYQYTMP